MGAEGTPYEGGLYFFDFQFPASYPADPPEAFYHSGGIRINPNLYANGKVCLSLLNTWMGKVSRCGGELRRAVTDGSAPVRLMQDTEVWKPASSSLLQVLVSIQGLILVEKPYYNEVLLPSCTALAALRPAAFPAVQL